MLEITHQLGILRVDKSIKNPTVQMSQNAILIETGNKVRFRSEAALEDFIWSNLFELLGLTPLKRQYEISKQYCDILAVSQQRELVIIELKNTEDRYIASLNHLNKKR